MLERLGSDTNGTALVESTFEKLRALYPDSGWLLQTEDLATLVVWASSSQSHARRYPDDPAVRIRSRGDPAE